MTRNRIEAATDKFRVARCATTSTAITWQMHAHQLAVSQVLLQPWLFGGLALRPLCVAPTFRLMTALFQHPDASPLDDPIHDQPQDASHNEAPQLCPLQPL